jgi:hypothetical protein
LKINLHGSPILFEGVGTEFVRVGRFFGVHGIDKIKFFSLLKMVR